MLYKIIIFILLKIYSFRGCYEFFILYFDQNSLVSHFSQNKNFCYLKCKEKSSYPYCDKYNSINWSIYQDSIYIVKPGDTLFYIAWITGNNYLDLAKYNNIKNVNVLRVNQVLNVKNNIASISFLKKRLGNIFLLYHESYNKIKKMFSLKKK